MTDVATHYQYATAKGRLVSMRRNTNQKQLREKKAEEGEVKIGAELGIEVVYWRLRAGTLKEKKKEGCQLLNLQQSADIDSTQRCNTVALLYSLLQLAPPHEATCGAKWKLEYYIFDTISTPSAGSITA